MFNGGVTWPVGVAAPHVLESYLTTGPAEQNLPAMPPGLPEVLRRCLQYDPADRWGNLSEVTEMPRSIYRRAVGTDHPRAVPADQGRGRWATAEHDRRSVWGEKWSDPRKWVRAGLLADRRDPSESGAKVPARV